MEFFQHKILPFGIFVAVPVVGWATWAVRKPQLRRLVVWVLAVGFVAAVGAAAALGALYRLPWAYACLDCLSSNPMFSVAITGLQGFGFGSALALGIHRLYSQSHASAA
jgi:hypothetical protein